MPHSSLTPVARARLSHRISTPTSPTSPEPVKSPDLLEEQKEEKKEEEEEARNILGDTPEPPTVVDVAPAVQEKEILVEQGEYWMNQRHIRANAYSCRLGQHSPSLKLPVCTHLLTTESLQ